MKHEVTLSHRFVEYIPEDLVDDVIYVSVAFATVAHKCCCGCGNEVITPLSPTDWKLTFDGETVSLDPSVGNWRFPCQSHYWIKRDRVSWAPKWSQEEIRAARAHNELAKKRNLEDTKVAATSDAVEGGKDRPQVKGLWLKLKRWLS